MKHFLLTTAFSICWAAAAAGETADDYNLRARHAETPQERLKLLDRALAINPNHVPALAHRARVHLALGNKELAFADMLKAADLVPGDPELNLTAAALASGLKKHQESARLSARAVAADRANFGYRTLYVYALIKALKIDEAVAQAEIAVRRHPEIPARMRPGRPSSYWLRAEAYEWAGRYKEAADDLTRIIQVRPRDFALYAQRGTFYRSMGDGKRALADARRYQRMGGSPSGAHAAVGCSYEVLGQLERALDAYAKAADTDDQREYFKIWSCIILRKLGRRQEADTFIKEFRKTFKEDGWIAPVVKYLAGETTEAEVFHLAKHDDPETNRQQYCEAYYYVGACYLAEKKLDKAEELMKKCLKQGVVNFYEHGFALRDLRTIKKLREGAAKKAAEAGAP